VLAPEAGTDESEVPLMAPTVPLAQRAAARRPRSGAATAAVILGAAHKEFAARGFSGGRMDRIAQRAQVNKALIYHHYSSKEGLFLAVLEHAYERARSPEQELHLDQIEPREAMERLVEFTFDSFVKDRTFIKLLNDENLHGAVHLKKSQRIAEMHSPLLTTMRKILARGGADGVFRADVDPVQTWISIAALSYFYFSNIHTLSTIFNRDFDTEEAHALRRRHVVDLILSALEARPVGGKR
jgi:TetR/AcrR family transcriptional regulator